MPLSRSTASPSDRLFYRPDIRFSVPRDLLFTPRFWSSFSTPSFFPPNLPFPVIWVAGSLFVPPYGWPAVFTAPRFLPLRGFYRSAVFTAPRFLPLRGFYRSAVFYRSAFTGSLGGLCSSAALVLAVPQSSPHFRAARSLGHLPVRLRILPLRDFYRSTVFTAPRFLPLRGFYRSAVFTAPRFLPLRDFFRSDFAGSLGGSAFPFCPPVFALFRAHPVLPAPPSRLRGDTVLDLLFGPPA